MADFYFIWLYIKSQFGSDFLMCLQMLVERERFKFCAFNPRKQLPKFSNDGIKIEIGAESVCNSHLENLKWV